MLHYIGLQSQFAVQPEQHVVRVRGQWRNGIDCAGGFVAVSPCDARSTIEFKFDLMGHCPYPNSELRQGFNQADKACTIWAGSVEDVPNGQVPERRKPINHDIELPMAA